MPRPIKEEPEAPPDLEKMLTEAKSQKMAAQLREWGVELERLRTRAGRIGADAVDEYEQQAQVLRAKMDEAQDRLRELQQAGANATYEMLKRDDGAWNELQRAFEDAGAKFG